MDFQNLIDTIQWSETESIRVLWFKADGIPRAELAQKIERLNGESIIFPIVLRDILFTNANAVLADFARLVDGAAEQFKSLHANSFSKLTIVILSNERFSLPQVSSPVFLPAWFPILGGRETVVRISDVFEIAELELLNSNSARIELFGSLLYQIESTMVMEIALASKADPRRFQSLLDTINSEDKASVDVAVEKFQSHIKSVAIPRAYRPGAKSKNSLLSKLIYQAIKSSPDTLASISKKVSSSFCHSHKVSLKPTLFAIMLRPNINLSATERNWHSAIVAMYQAYQLMNAAAHAGEYPSYPADLVLSNAKDLVRFLTDFHSLLASSETLSMD